MVDKETVCYNERETYFRKTHCLTSSHVSAVDHANHRPSAWPTGTQPFAQMQQHNLHKAASATRTVANHWLCRCLAVLQYAQVRQYPLNEAAAVKFTAARSFGEYTKFALHLTTQKRSGITWYHPN